MINYMKKIYIKELKITIDHNEICNLNVFFMIQFNRFLLIDAFISSLENLLFYLMLFL